MNTTSAPAAFTRTANTVCGGDRRQYVRHAGDAPTTPLVSARAARSPAPSLCGASLCSAITNSTREHTLKRGVTAESTAVRMMALIATLGPLELHVWRAPRDWRFARRIRTLADRGRQQHGAHVEGQATPITELLRAPLRASGSLTGLGDGGDLEPRCSRNYTSPRPPAPPPSPSHEAAVLV